MLRTGPALDLLAGPAHHVYATFGKRGLDLFLVLMALPFLLPLMLLIACAVALDGRTPFFVQDRLGRDWRRFRLYKFRTMVYDAEDRLRAHLAADPEARAEWDLHQKLRHDPRVTRVGHFLRATSMDELPQLINVMRGQMSLVGPRPMMVDQRDQYPGEDYAAMLPGLTGLWQVSERSTSSFAARADYDREYRRVQGLRTDLLTIARTFAVVARCTGV